jgi:hypothetical protein
VPKPELTESDVPLYELPLPANLFLLKRRITAVPGYGLFRVCSFIVRVDSYPVSKGETHGWQVRYQRPHKFFSDSKYDGDPCQSAQAAATLLAKQYAGPHLHRASVEWASKKDKTGYPGIRVVHKKQKNKKFSETYIEIVPPQAGLVQKRIYVGTDNSVSEARMQAAIAQAVATRSAWVAEIEAQHAEWYRESLRKLTGG